MEIFAQKLLSLYVFRTTAMQKKLFRNIRTHLQRNKQIIKKAIAFVTLYAQKIFLKKKSIQIKHAEQRKNSALEYDHLVYHSSAP